MTIKAFYFSTEQRKLRYDDNRPIVVGETHVVDGEIKLCHNGLHASKRLLDAVDYAPGNILYHVELSGDMDVGTNKLCARNRKYLAEFDATEVLKKFARVVALDVVELIKPYCSESDYNTIVDFLNTGNAAHSAYAASDAAYATRVAARAAVYADVYAVDAVDAANAAYAAVGNAAYAAASYASNITNKDYNDLLTTMVKDASGWDI